jgi:hypothetical protein
MISAAEEKQQYPAKQTSKHSVDDPVVGSQIDVKLSGAGGIVVKLAARSEELFGERASMSNGP